MDYRFFNRLGASELDRTICSVAGGEAIRFTLGAKTGTDPETYVYSKLIVVWGSNPVSTNPHLMPFIKKARQKGAQMVVIDPRRTRTAAQADWHIQPQPGTDAALALGVMHVLITEGMTDEAYIAAHTHGYAALRERAMEYPPARVAADHRVDRRGDRPLRAEIRDGRARRDPRQLRDAAAHERRHDDPHRRLPTRVDRLLRHARRRTYPLDERRPADQQGRAPAARPARDPRRGTST